MIVTTSARRTSKRANPDPVVLIRSSAYSSLPAPGNRVGPSDAANMPTIQASTGNPAFVTAAGAHHFRLVGLNIKAPTTLLQDALVKVGGGETLLSQFPTDITVDRCIVKGDTTNGLRRGVAMDAIRGAVIDSYVYDCKEVGADSQAVWAYNTPGPLKVVNNYLEAAGENIMFGGAAQNITDVYPSDIEIRRNYIFKPTAWTGSSWTVKNHVEFKSGSRVLFEGNVLENCPADDQNGDSILVAPKEGAGGSDWNRSDDVTIRYNKLVNVGQGILASGTDTSSTVRVHRLTIKHNLLDVTGYNGASRRMFTIVYGGESYEIEHNTGFINVTNAGATVYADSSGGTKKVDGFTFQNNIFSSDFYGFYGSGSGIGTVALDGHFINWTFTNNAMIGGSGYTYPANTWYPANTTAVKFTNFAGGDYSLASDSDYKAGAVNDATDNTDLGADITALNAAILNTVTGQWGSEPATYTDRTYTNAELPRTYVDTRYANQTGTTHVCTTAAQFTTALANCALGDIIELQAGTTFTGSFTLRNI